jgi:ubiquinone/menaquinone biosynthesis C-methylase UbiE
MSEKPLGTREWYDFIGQLADILPGIHVGGHQATEALLDMCQVGTARRILDIGCGPGNTACLIAERFGSQVWGIDLSEVMVAKAVDRARRRGVSSQVVFQVADGFRLPFADGVFDVVIVESVLTPMPGDKRQALDEMVRVVRPGGRVGANEATVDPSMPPDLLALFDEHPAIHGYFTAETMRKLFEEAGLEAVQLTEAKGTGTPSALQEMGVRGLLSFMIKVYPKILFKLLSDARFRRASKIDGAITKRSKEYMGYALVVGQKPV